MCKNKKPNEMKTMIILIDSSDDVKHGEICSVCNFALKDIFNTRELQTKQLTLLDGLGIKQ